MHKIRITSILLIGLLWAVTGLSAKELKPNSSDWDKFEEAKSYFANGDLEEARDKFFKLYREYSRDPNLNYQLGMTFAALDGITNRAQAVKYLKKAIKYEKDSVDWYYDLGIVLNRSDMKLPAYDKFREVLEKDSTYLEAYFQIIDYCVERFFHNHNTDKLSEAYQTALAGESHFKYNSTMLYKKALVSMLYSSNENAQRTLHEIFAPDTLQMEITLLDAYLYYKKREFLESHKKFLEAFQMMPEDMRRGYQEIELLLSPQGQRDYEDLSAIDKRRFADSLWKSLDPDLTTVLNEKKVEHYARVYFAELMFAQPNLNKHGWETDQGGLYVRYGPPQSARWYLPYDNDPKLHTRWEWTYNFNNKPVTLTFLNLMGGDHYQLAPMDYGYSDFKAYELTGDVPNQETFAQNAVLINSYFSHFVHKGRQGQSILDMFVATAYDQFEYKNESGHASCDIQYRIGLHDSSGAIITLDSTDLHLVISPTLMFNPDFYHFSKISLIPPPQKYEAAFAIEQKSAYRLNIYRMPVEVYDFTDDGFHLSSLILGAKIEEPEAGSPFNRGDIKLIPNYTSTYKNSDSLIIYYELYDLPTNIRGRTKFRLTYSIREEKRSSNVFNFIGGLFADGRKTEIIHSADMGDIHPDRTESLKIDLSNLRPGDYSFNLTIEELILGGTACQIPDCPG